MAGFLFLGSCTSGISDSTPSTTTVAAVATGDILQGLNLGAALTQPVTETASTGAILPASFGDLQALFIAVTTSTPATGLITGAPTDTNGGADVFVTAVVSLADSSGVPTAFDQELLGIFHNPRCANCHSFPVTAPVGHPGGFDPSVTCSNCHTSATTGIANQAWFAPLTIGETLDFQNKTADELVAQINTWEVPKLAANPAFVLADHFTGDPRIEWAITSGTVPLGRPPKVTVPVTLDRFFALMRAWDSAGRPATSAAAVQSIALVSQNAAGNASDGISGQPTVTYVPAVAPAAMAPVGTLYVAFVSTATDLTGMAVAGGNRQIYRAQFEVFVQNDNTIRLNPTPANNTLISFTAGNVNAPSNDHCDSPAISPDGQDVAFESLATDLDAGFTPTNGAMDPDVYVYHSVGPDVEPVSATAASMAMGGDGPSRNPVIDSAGQTLAFESEATNLVAGDTNGVSDVFYRCVTGAGCGFGMVQRASVATGGTEGTGGASNNPSVAFVGGRILVAFDSAKTNLTTVPVSSTVRQVYLHDNTGAMPTTTLISQTKAGAAGNGGSSQPSLSPKGSALAFTTTGTNLDDVRPDTNNVADVVLADLSNYFVDGTFCLERQSVSPSGVQGDAASTAADLGSFQRAALAFESDYLNFSTAATNLGASTTTSLITSFFSPNFNPTCDLQGPTVTLSNTMVTFDGSASADPDNDAIANYAWDLGDGTQMTGAQVTHAYAPTMGMASVNRTVSLTVTDARGARSTCTSTIQVNANNTAPTAALAMVADQAVGFVVNFDASGSTDPDPGDMITSYAWDFGDGTMTTTAGPTTTHTYAAANTFTASVTVTDNFAGTSTASTMVNVFNNNAPSATVSNVATVAEDNSVVFSVAGLTDENPGTVTYSWAVDGGAVMGGTTGSTLTVFYCAPRNPWTVTLTMTDQFGATGMAQGTVNVTGAAIDFTIVYNTLINGTCNGGGCHNGAVQNPAMNTEAIAFARLRNGAGGTLGSCATNNGFTYVDTVGFDPSPTASFLVDKLESTNPACGGRMPDGGTPFTTCEVDTVKSWIAAGANP